MSRTHSDLKTSQTQNRTLSVQLKCSFNFCTTEYVDVKGIISHLSGHIEEGLAITCPFDGCSKMFHVKPSFSSHISRYHRGWNESQISAVLLCDVAEQHLEETVSEQSSSESDVRRMMAETYSVQRAAINRGNSISKLLEDWPFLFEAIHLFDHTTTLLGFPVQTRLAEELSKKEKTIKDFLGSRGVDIPGSDAVQLLHPESPDLDLPSTPCIFIMGEQLFKVAVDQMIVNDHIKSPIAALSYAFSMFYVLNIKYPKDMSLTLEFIQRVFLGLNPKRGSKAEMKGKKHHHIPPRLLKFVNELYDFDSPWKM
ncbi:uncharacterized protein LOC111610315 isoform X2 [Xiphophorus maculatus]|uniref:uncharacterized protein LOC111610315 isoform X2 n=1 Tax=Xiphophorus maculatus TaxID=8083 RepID=UPI000C6E7EF1|nr:uncharacterized protein LOC111610315 isoform X2 [Xiphophorus maculatus]